MQILQNIVNGIFLLLILDLFMLFGMAATIATGGSVAHIPFWDAQFRMIFFFAS